MDWLNNYFIFIAKFCSSKTTLFNYLLTYLWNIPSDHKSRQANNHLATTVNYTRHDCTSTQDICEWVYDLEAAESEPKHLGSIRARKSLTADAKSRIVRSIFTYSHMYAVHPSSANWIERIMESVNSEQKVVINQSQGFVKRTFIAFLKWFRSI